MGRDDHRQLVLGTQRRQRFEQARKAGLVVDVLFAMQADGEVFLLLQFECFKNPGSFDLLCLRGQDLLHRRAGLDDRLGADALGEQVAAGMLGVDEVDVAHVVDDAPVHFLWHALVERAVAGFHVEDGNLASLGGDRREAAVGVAEDQHHVGLVRRQGLVAAGDDVGDRLRSALGSGFEETVGLPQAEAVEEDLVQLVVVVLAGVHQHVLEGAVELGNDAGELDDLGPRAHDRHDLHASLWPLRSALVPGRSSSASAELNSPLSAFASAASRRSSGSIGRMAR